MKTTTRTAIHAALLSGPKTQTQLVAQTRLARSTVIEALQDLAVPFEPNTWPRQYRLDPETTPSLPVGVTTLGDDQIAVPRNPTDPARPWPARWDAARLEFGASVARTQILHDSNPVELAATFLRGASSLASIAEALTAAADSPDWFTKLGGTMPTETPETEPDND